MPEYLVIGPTAGTVEAWSTVRLPFEPRGWLVDFRRALRHAVGVLTAEVGPGHQMAATFTSIDPFRVDAENVLLYNVGMAAFGRPSSLRIERRMTMALAPPMAMSGPAIYHHRYSVDAAIGPVAWAPVRVAARWDTGALPTSTAPSTAANVWAAVRAASPDVLERLVGNQAFGIDVVVETPNLAATSLPGLTKSVLDGCISALHDHDGTDVNELAGRVAVKARLDKSEVERLLSPAGAPLGERRLLHRFRTGVQWNPADDLCVLADIRLKPAPHYGIRGELLVLDR